MHEPYWTSDDIKYLTACGVEVEESCRIRVDYVLDYMIKNRIALTRENYIALNGVPEEEIGGELEFEIPEIFRREDQWLQYVSIPNRNRGSRKTCGRPRKIFHISGVCLRCSRFANLGEKAAQ